MLAIKESVEKYPGPEYPLLKINEHHFETAFTDLYKTLDQTPVE